MQDWCSEGGWLAWRCGGGGGVDVGMGVSGEGKAEWYCKGLGKCVEGCERGDVRERE